MLEPVGILGALRRAVRLTQQQFWRLFGILLLMAVVVGFAGGILRLPFSIAGEVFLVGDPCRMACNFGRAQAARSG